MKIINKFTFATLAALAATLLFQTSIARADDGHDRGDRDRDHREHGDAKATFTKWVTAFPNQPGLIANFGGVVGGDVGNGTFTGELLLYSPGPTVSHFVAFYRFTGESHE